jgi:hypothetical protein
MHRQIPMLKEEIARAPKWWSSQQDGPKPKRTVHKTNQRQAPLESDSRGLFYAEEKDFLLLSRNIDYE